MESLDPSAGAMPLDSTTRARGGRWDYIFLYSNAPTPTMLDSVRLAVAMGRKVALVYCDRGQGAVVVDAINGCDVIRRPVLFTKVEWQRILSLPSLMIWLWFKVFRFAEQGCRTHTDSLDMLVIAKIVTLGKSPKFHHQVRDLHSLQLRRGFLPAIVQAAESVLLRRLDMLVLTSAGYYSEYYSRFYKGEYVVLENWPNLDSWRSFSPRPTDECIVAFVGIVRYLDCLLALVRAIGRLRDQGCNIRLKVAGGGDLDNLPQAIRTCDWVDFTGPFSYRNEIARIYSDVRVIWSVYDTRVPNVKVAMPSKYYESILSGIPIIVASGTYVAEQVRKNTMGTDVACLDDEAIANTLLSAVRDEGWYRQAVLSLQHLKPSLGSVQQHNKLAARAVLGDDSASSLAPDIRHGVFRVNAREREEGEDRDMADHDGVERRGSQKSGSVR